MSKPLNFQQIILTLQQYWAEHNCTLWQPYHEAVGAGTANPATILRVLGPEPWNVAYPEPSFRPDDGRYGDNPNRMQMHTQFQVILQPDPGNPQELYLGSLAALGLDRDAHDIRFVEDNWESPALGAWGLGWEVWLDGMEISQYTYFQQSGGMTLDPPAVELTYGLERIAMYLQGVKSVWDLDWDGRQSYGDILLRQEVEFCTYNFEVADIDGLADAFQFYEQEVNRCLDKGLVIPAHDYVLKCSHTFNILDTRGAIGVTERAHYFGRMRRLSHKVAKAFIEQRTELENPLLRYMPTYQMTVEASPLPQPTEVATDFLLEIGSEELPPHHLTSAIEQLRSAAPKFFADLRLTYDDIYISGTPRRQVVLVKNLAPGQPDDVQEFRGPAAKIAFDADGNPTRAALGFARGKGVDPANLTRKTLNGVDYVFAVKQVTGLPAGEALATALPNLLKQITFPRSMRWLASAQVGREVAGITYSRPIRWLVALLGDQIVPFEYAGLNSGNQSRGLRPEGSPPMPITAAGEYRKTLAEYRITLDLDERRRDIQSQLNDIAGLVGGLPEENPALLEEVTNLVEQPTAFLGAFDAAYLDIPAPVLTTVMKKHQRYFPVLDKNGALMPYFIGVRNGGALNLDTVRAGNEGVLIARYADAQFFFKADTQKPLADFLPRLDTLTFQEKLGSMLDKSKRLEAFAPAIGDLLGLSAAEQQTLSRAAHLCKADLATQMVVELTSLQGQMGYEYAKLGGESEAVATAIREHYLPGGSGDPIPQTSAGLALSLTNRLDSLIGLFAVGLAPTGSADPFALRREALGLATILLETGRTFSVRQGLALAAKHQPVDVAEAVLNETATFVTRRLEGLLREQGFAADVVSAVLTAQADNPAGARQAAADLAAAIAAPNWETTLTAFARCVRLVRKVDTPLTFDAALLTEPAAEALYQAYHQAQTSLSATASLAEIIATISDELVDPINTFFDDVLVMDKNEMIRNNRLALLQLIGNLTAGAADFSQLKGF